MERDNWLNLPRLLRMSDEVRNGGAPAGTVDVNDNATIWEEKERIFERVEQEMEIFRREEYSRFQASSRVANELGKWEGGSDKEKGKALDSYLVEINSFTASQDEEQSTMRGTSLPVGTSLTARQQSNGKQI